jgi:hypothetical protein
MKRLTFLTILTILLVCGANAQVHEQATVAWISIPDVPSDPFLCIFGNTIEDITLIDSMLDLNGKEVRYLRQREESSPNQTFTREFQRLNARFMSVHIVQRRLIEKNGKVDFETYFLVDVYERVSSKYYLVASNNY